MTQPDGGRRAGPVALSEPTDQDREQVAQLQAEARDVIDQAETARQDAAEPAGVQPSAEQRAAVVDNETRSADLRARAARPPRATPIGDVYDDERERVAELQATQRKVVSDSLADRGAVDPAFEASSAGFDPSMPHLPGSELYGNFECAKCKGNIERAFPGYVDWDAASRDLVCPHCGTRKRMGPEPAAATPEPAAAPDVVVQTSAQNELSAAERAELEALRLEKQQRAEDDRAELARLNARSASPAAPTPTPTTDQAPNP